MKIYNRKAFIIILCIVCVCVAVASCGKGDAGAAAKYSPMQIAEIIIDGQPGEPGLYPLTPGDSLFTDYLSVHYRLDAADIEDGAVFYADGADATEIAVLLFADGTAAGKASEALAGYRERRVSALTGYMPEQAKLVEKGVVATRGAYAALFICGDTADAEKLFNACFGSDPPALPGSVAAGSGGPAGDAQGSGPGGASGGGDDGQSSAAAAGSADGQPQQQGDASGGDRGGQGGAPGSQSGGPDSADGAVGGNRDGQSDQSGASGGASGDASGGSSGGASGDAAGNAPGNAPGDPSGADGSPGLSGSSAGDGSADSEAERPGSASDANSSASPQPSSSESSPQSSESSQPSAQQPGAPADAFDPDAVLTAWRTGDTSPLSEKNKAILDACSAVIGMNIRSGMTDYDKELAIHDWIVLWTTYDVEANNNSPNAKPDPDNDNPYGLFYSRKSVCSGYSSTFQLFMDMLDVECITVKGHARDLNTEHAWNMVRLDGDWYCVDVTWNDPTGSVPLDYISHEYFNVTSQFLRDTKHIWDETTAPEATATAYSWRNMSGKS